MLELPLVSAHLLLSGQHVQVPRHAEVDNRSRFLGTLRFRVQPWCCV
jgi:hypothetical protein